MDSETFVQVMKVWIADREVQNTIGTILKPGKNPTAVRSRLNEWFSTLTERDRQRVEDAIHLAVNGLMFEFFCVLDGVKPIENGPEKGRLELWYTRGESRTLLNDRRGEPLHDVFRSLIDDVI